MEEMNIFETTNVDLASFLMFEEIKLLECRRDGTNHRVVVFRFLDEAQNCLDLERVYLSSNFKKFRDINKYLLKKIHATLRES